jgi:pimeloyl-[acyl-carrier protein] methyl ester esterase
MVENLYFESIGEGSTIVLLHGWGLNSKVWQPWAEKLSQNYQVILVDLPGFGQSGQCLLADYQLSSICELLNNTIQKPALYVGWSLGGLVASQMAIQYPQKVQALVTVASSPHFVQTDDWPGIKPLVLRSFYQQLAKDSDQTIANFLKIQAMGSPSIRQEIKQLQQLILSSPQPSVTTLKQSLALLENTDLRPQLSKITQPFLRVYGKLDTLVPKAVIPKVDVLAPSSDVIVFDKASHAPFMSSLEEFHHEVSLWLAINYGD